MRRGPLIFLIAVTIIPAVTLTIVLVKPPPNHRYLTQQVFLLGLGAAMATWSLSAPSRAVFVYCTLALLPVLSMMDYHHDTINNPLTLVYTSTPVIGIFFVMLLTKSDRYILAYGFVSLAFMFIVGKIYRELGLSGILCILSALVTLGALFAVNCSRMRMRKEMDQEREELRTEISRVRESTGELGALGESILQKYQEIAQHDP